MVEAVAIKKLILTLTYWQLSWADFDYLVNLSFSVFLLVHVASDESNRRTGTMWGKWGYFFCSRSTQGWSAAEAPTRTGDTLVVTGGEGFRDIRSAVATGYDFALYPCPSVKRHWQCLETFLVGTIRTWILLQSSGMRPGMLLNTLQCTGQTPTTKTIKSKMSVMSRLSNILTHFSQSLIKNSLAWNFL